MLSRSETTIRHTYTYTYMVTISAFNKAIYVDKTHIDQVMGSIKYQIPSLKVYLYAYELGGKYHQLHFHGIVQTRTPVHYKVHNSYWDFRVQWSPVYNLNACIKYLTKETEGSPFKQEQILCENYWSHHTCFTKEEQGEEEATPPPILGVPTPAETG